MEKKKEMPKNSNHFEEEYDNLCNEMVKEIIKKLNKMDCTPEIGLVVCDDLDNASDCRYLKEYGEASKRIDIILKIGGHWVFAVHDMKHNTADCFSIDGKDDITLELLDYDNLFTILQLLETYEKEENT